MVNRNFKLPFLGSSKFTFLCLSAVLILLGKAQFQAAATSEVFTQVEKLSSTRRQDRLAAVRSLRQIGSPVVPILMEALESPEPSIRKNAAFALGSMGSEAVEAIPALFSALTTWEQTDRIDAALALHQIALASPDNLNRVLAELETALGDQSASVRQGATVGLGLFGAAATPAIDPLIATLQDPDEEVRVGAAIALKRIGAPAIPALTAALTHENAQVRAKAAFALGRINAAAMPKVAATLETSDRQIRQTAAQSLENFQPLNSTPSEAIPQLVAQG